MVMRQTCVSNPTLPGVTYGAIWLHPTSGFMNVILIIIIIIIIIIGTASVV